MGGGSLNQISKMLDAHYKGDINIANYWNVGDIRKEVLEPIAKGTTDEDQPFQDIALIILDFNHDELESKVGIRSRSAVTIQLKSDLSTKGYMAPGYKTRKDGAWSTSARRTWCNSDFYNVLFPQMRSLVKPVVKYTYGINPDGSGYVYEISKSVDKIFLLAVAEVIDITGYESNVLKKYPLFLQDSKPEYRNSWLRTSTFGSYQNDSSFNVRFYRIGNNNYNLDNLSSGDVNGIRPAFCL